MDGSTIKSRIKSLLRSPSIKLRKNRGLIKENFTNKVTLERVLGITATGNSGLTCDPCSGTIAYPAGCVAVLLNPKKNREQHIINTSRKSITTLSFSSDGKYLVTGEAGHLPAVRVWDVAEGSQVTELQEHKYGIACVAFSPNSKYIVSVGYQHDMGVNVWAWKKNTLVAANKVSSKVSAVSFSEDGSYFVTAGVRHVRFWYLEPCNLLKQLAAPVPLLGRSALLGELQNNTFSDVACGYGAKSECTFSITSSGLLCEFNEKRMLDKWMDLRTRAARALSATEELIFCACADGMVRVFSSSDLRPLCVLPHPHHLGSDVTRHSPLFTTKPDARYPDSVAVTYDPVNLWLSCVYNDHSLYVWDVHELQRVVKVHSALYHSAGVWDLQICPEDPEGPATSPLSSGLFVTCSEDGTIRTWNTEAFHGPASGSLLSCDLRKVIYIDSNADSLLDMEGTAAGSAEKAEDQMAQSRTGVRTVCVSPDGKHLASGDRVGTLRVHDLNSMEEILSAEVHDSEVLCLEYSKSETGMKLLATAGRDRLIHVLNVEEDYRLLQSLDEHSSSITALRFAVDDGKVRLISCGADKSVYFRTAHRTFRGVRFKCTHHVVRKSTLCDLDVDPTCKYAAVGGQDRNIRVFNINNGKQKRSFKGSRAEDGSLLRVQLDPSGLYVATSCTDKNLSLFDFQSGECLATQFGHSEIITGIKFTSDCRRLISVSGDSCIFVWRLAPELTLNMRQRLEGLRHCSSKMPFISTAFRRASTGSPNLLSRLPLLSCSSETEEEEDEERAETLLSDQNETIPPVLVEEAQGTSDEGTDLYISTKRLPAWSCSSEPQVPEFPRRRRRWSCRMGSLDLIAKSMLELRQLDASSRSGSARVGSAGQLCDRGGDGVGRSPHPTAALPGSKKRPARSHPAWASGSSPEPEGVVLYPEFCPSRDSGSSTGYGGSSLEQDPGGSEDAESFSSEEEQHGSAEEPRVMLFHPSDSGGPERSLKEHLHTVTDTDTIGNQFGRKGSISATFVVPGSFIRAGRRSDEGPRATVKPLVSAVCPQNGEKGQWACLEERVEANPSEQTTQQCSTAQRSRGSGSRPGSVASPMAKPATGLLKTMSEHSLPADSRNAVTLSRLRRDSRSLNTERSDTTGLPSPTCSSSPLPWESPGASRRFRAHSYMSPTTSSRAKLNRLASVGDGLHLAGSGSGAPCPGPFRSLSSTPPRTSLSASLPGLCNSAELAPRSSEGAQTPPPKSSKTSGPWRSNNPGPDYLRTRDPHPEYCSRAVMSTGDAASANTCPGNRVQCMDTDAFSRTPQRERPLVAVQAFAMTSEGQADEDLPVTLEVCRQSAAELCSSVRKVARLSRTVNSCPGVVEAERQEMVRVLGQALLLVQAELEVRAEVKPWSSPGTGVGEHGERTFALLEQYSQLLLQSVEKRLHHRT